MRIEDERLERCVGVALRGRDAGHDRLEDLRHSRSVLRAREDDLLTRDREHVFKLLDDDVWLGRRQVDLVEDRDDREALAEGEVDVRERLRLDPLCGVNDEQRALTGLQAPAHLVREVDVARRVDQIEAIREAVVRRVLESHGPGLDRDPFLPLEVHRIEDLAHHLPPFDRVGQLEQPICERGLPVIDVGDDAEVAEAGLGDGHEAGV